MCIWYGNTSEISLNYLYGKWTPIEQIASYFPLAQQAPSVNAITVSQARGYSKRTNVVGLQYEASDTYEPII